MVQDVFEKMLRSILKGENLSDVPDAAWRLRVAEQTYPLWPPQFDPRDAWDWETPGLDDPKVVARARAELVYILSGLQIALGYRGTILVPLYLDSLLSLCSWVTRLPARATAAT
jgi:hypothetical protein